MRVLILGNGGSGKSHLAKRISKLLKVEPIHLDRFYWKTNWQHTSVEEWEGMLFSHIYKEVWIMEGTPIRDIELRISLADFIIFLDMPRCLCIVRIILKGIFKLVNINRHYNDGCPIKGLSFKAIKWVWDYPYKIKPIIFPYLTKKQHVIYLKNKSETTHFIKNFHYLCKLKSKIG